VDYHGRCLGGMAAAEQGPEAQRGQERNQTKEQLFVDEEPRASSVPLVERRRMGSVPRRVASKVEVDGAKW